MREVLDLSVRVHTALSAVVPPDVDDATKDNVNTLLTVSLAALFTNDAGWRELVGKAASAAIGHTHRSMLADLNFASKMLLKVADGLRGADGLAVLAIFCESCIGGVKDEQGQPLKVDPAKAAKLVDEAKQRGWGAPHLAEKIARLAGVHISASGIKAATKRERGAAGRNRD